jgi:hypothetical protein
MKPPGGNRELDRCMRLIAMRPGLADHSPPTRFFTEVSQKYIQAKKEN